MNVSLAAISRQCSPYIRLTRLHRPIGIWLLLWPTLWALWISSPSGPSWKLVVVFVLGTLLMRSAGCAINDYADRDIDRHVKRTADRPVTSGEISPKSAVWVAMCLALTAAALLLSLDPACLPWAVAAAVVAASYPYTKRFLALPQAYLGLAFSMGIPMAYAATLGGPRLETWLLVAANFFWTVAYDTEYAMVDRDDDLRLKIKTSAITLGSWDRVGVGICYACALALLVALGVFKGFGVWYFTACFIAGGLSFYHLWLIRNRERTACFKAFLHNTWWGAAIFAGIVLDTLTHGT